MGSTNSFLERWEGKELNKILERTVKRGNLGEVGVGGGIIFKYFF
jgi:hypothetical protein